MTRRPRREVMPAYDVFGRRREAPARCLPGRARSEAVGASRGGATDRRAGDRVEGRPTLVGRAESRRGLTASTGLFEWLRSREWAGCASARTGEGISAWVEMGRGDDECDASGREAHESIGCDATGNGGSAQRTREWSNASRSDWCSASDDEGAAAWRRRQARLLDEGKTLEGVASVGIRETGTSHVETR